MYTLSFLFLNFYYYCDVINLINVYIFQINYENKLKGSQFFRT